jgi:hypothetical protein
MMAEPPEEFSIVQKSLQDITAMMRRQRGLRIIPYLLT